MKKLFLVMAFALAVVATGFAQKANVNRAKNKALAVEAPDFQGAKDDIEAALVNDETKGLANTWYVAGLVYEKAADAEYNLWRATGNCNKIQMGEDVLKAYKYYLKAYELDQLPDAKGKVKPKFTKKITTSMLNFYINAYLVHYGIEKQGSEEWLDAFNAFKMHTSILDVPFVAVDKNVPAKDTSYYEIKYFTAQYAWRLEDYSSAISIFNEIKDQSYNSNGAYQSLCQLYLDTKDTVNYVSTLEKGLAKFPNEFYYLGNLINYYILTNQPQIATELLDKAIESSPNNAELYNARGDMFRILQKNDDAIINYDKAIELQPNLKNAYNGKAITIYNQAVGIENNAFNYGVGQEDLYDKEMAKAIEVFKKSIPFFEKVIELDPEDYETMRTLRGLFLKLSNSDPSYQAKYDEIDKKIKGY